MSKFDPPPCPGCDGYDCIKDDGKYHCAYPGASRSSHMAQKFNGLDPKTNDLVFPDGAPRDPGIDPETKEYSTAQMLFDEIHGGDTSQPLFD